MRLVVLSAGFVALGGFLVSEGHVLGWLCIAFSGIGVVVGLISLVPGVSYLELRGDGFEFTTLHRKWFQRWSDVQEFFPERSSSIVMVCWNYAPGYVDQPRARKLSAGIAGVEAALPDTYGMSADQLAALMNQWRIRYAGRADSSAGSPGPA